MTAGDISVSSTHRHSHPHNLSHTHNRSRHLEDGSSTPPPTTTMAHHHLSSAERHEYLDASRSPVPSLTNATLRSSSVSSSVNSLSPDAHQATTPRDLLPQFQSVSSACHASIDSVANNVGTGGMELKKRRRNEEEGEEKKEEEVHGGSGDGGEAARSVPPPPPLPQQQPESKKIRTTRRLVNGERRPLTGSTDFVKLCGLNGLYDEYVRPYIVDGQVRRTMSDLASSHYLRGVTGAVLDSPGSPDFFALAKAPPKTEFAKLELIPMASLRAAFAIGGDERTKKPVEKHQDASEQPKSHQQSRQSNSGTRRYRSEQSTPASQPKKARY
ncbi:hypothetical protein GGI19_003948 [Coemansia pectinata]|uniref:Mediator complex subunit 19 n=1 Tax=Coemansia pectinata TaxID=1052879 RepID=A0A9W8GYN4_9FUNG|nr:hypothetical protein GGI19_003948 [Coemansia pectinata]KAJ2874842.1 hypothetical protein GGH93_002094 [Coemansia aciculifera]